MPSSGGKKSALDRKSTRLNSSHDSISYAVFFLKKKKSLNSSHRTISYTAFCLDTRTRTLSQASSHVTSVHVVWLLLLGLLSRCVLFFFFNDTATTEIYTLSLHDLFR